MIKKLIRENLDKKIDSLVERVLNTYFSQLSKYQMTDPSVTYTVRRGVKESDFATIIKGIMYRKVENQLDFTGEKVGKQIEEFYKKIGPLDYQLLKDSVDIYDLPDYEHAWSIFYSKKNRIFLVLDDGDEFIRVYKLLKTKEELSRKEYDKVVDYVGNAYIDEGDMFLLPEFSEFIEQLAI